VTENRVSCNDCLWCFWIDEQALWCDLGKDNSGGDCPHFIPAYDDDACEKEGRDYETP